VTRVAFLALLAAAALLAGCGGEAGGSGPGEAALWVTRDRGETLLLEREVEAGQTVMEALRQVADVDTGYGGRFVRAIDGLEGSLERGVDWLYFVNGILADRGAAEYRIRPGDVVWWDHHRWVGEPEPGAVVGAFPEPFLHGYGGRRPPAAVTYEEPEQERGARAIAELIGAETVALAGAAPAGANVFAIVSGAPRFTAEALGPAGPVRFSFAGDAEELARDPGRHRFRFEVGG
jgi:hypothetical protein